MLEFILVVMIGYQPGAHHPQMKVREYYQQSVHKCKAEEKRINESKSRGFSINAMCLSRYKKKAK